MTPHSADHTPLVFGAIADDLTGGLELASMLIARGVPTTLSIGPGAPARYGSAHVFALKSRVAPASEAVGATLAAIHYQPTGQALACERAFLAALDGSCRTPIAGYATLAGGSLSFNGLIITPDGTQSHTVAVQGPAADAARIGREAGVEVRARAGENFFDWWR